MRHLALQRGSLRLAPWRSSSVAKPPSITAQPPHCFRKSIIKVGDAVSRVPSPICRGLEITGLSFWPEMPETRDDGGVRELNVPGRSLQIYAEGGGGWNYTYTPRLNGIDWLVGFESGQLNSRQNFPLFVKIEFINLAERDTETRWSFYVAWSLVWFEHKQL